MFAVTVCVPFSTLDTQDRRSQLCTLVNTVNSVGEHGNFLAGNKQIQEELCMCVCVYMITYTHINTYIWFGLWTKMTVS